MGLLARGQAFLNRRMKSAAGVAVTYRRGANAEDIVAELGRTVFRQTAPAPGGASLIWGDRDYLIHVEDIADTFGEPLTGDVIEETIDDVVCVFEILTPDTGEPAVRYSDQTRTKWRVHCKQVG